MSNSERTTEDNSISAVTRGLITATDTLVGRFAAQFDLTPLKFTAREESREAAARAAAASAEWSRS